MEERLSKLDLILTPDEQWLIGILLEAEARQKAKMLKELQKNASKRNADN